ncbi:MAG TPA: (Fe-S)-binding protein [Acidobacteriaceae bacterium]|nr:(Fe-S)-binding protein [Acidobacteriaceae bacterium]
MQETGGVPFQCAFDCYGAPPYAPQHFSRFELALLLALGLLSVAVFLRRFAPILRNIFRARREPGYSLRPVARRIWTFISEVLLQSKVIRQRPLPGIAHAFVWWGFLAFALVSLNHLALPFGADFLSRDDFTGSFYFLFAGAWAILVAISITGLFVRRFLVRPIWLGKKPSIESGVIALLIFLLMATYLVAFFVSKEPAVTVLWWAHTLTLLVFLPLIPHTKHLHLVLSPFTVFLKREGFSAIPPLAGDDDLGLTTGRDLTQIVALQAYSCVECGRCTEHCPAANTGKVLNPKEIALGTRDYLNAFSPTSEAPLLAELRDDGLPKPASPHLPLLSMEAAFQCTTCGACEFQCPVGIQHLPLIVGLRRGATNTGVWEDTYGTKLFLNLEKSGNSLGMPATERDRFIAKESLPIFDGTQEYCLWLGCMGSYDPRGREIIADFARIMRHLGSTFGVLRKEKCTGDPARRLGNDLVFQSLAESGLESLKAARVQKIVSICPHCVRTIATDWREFGIAPQIEHHSEFLARYASKLPAPPSTKSAERATDNVVYHDPCYLGRYRDVYDEPRAVVSQHAALVEAPRHKERGFCCGAGGGLAFLGEESGERVSHNRARELAATGADAIATACPFCNTMLRDALVSITPAGAVPPQLVDIAQLTARSLPQKDASAQSAPASPLQN